MHLLKYTLFKRTFLKYAQVKRTALTYAVFKHKAAKVRMVSGAIVLMTVCLPPASFALPSAYVSDTKLKNVGPINTASTLIADNENPSRVWVLPPKTGEIAYRDFVASSNTPMCASLKELLIEMQDIDAQIKGQRQRIKEREPQLAKAHQLLVTRRNELADLGDKPSIKEMILLESRGEDIDQRIAELIEELDATVDAEVMAAIKAELKELREERRGLRQELKELRKTYRKDYKAYSTAKRRYEAAQQNFAEVDADIKQLIGIWQSFQEDILRTYKNRGRIHSGTAAVDYETGWQQELAGLQASYSQLEFVAMPTFNSRIYAGFFAATDEDSYYRSLPPLMSYSVNGQAQLPWGKRLPVSSGERGASGLAAVVVGDFHYNLIGGCPIVDREFFTEVPFDVERRGDGLPRYGLSASYEYDMAFSFAVEASYNLFKVYEKIAKYGTKGGFFTSKSYADVVESQFDEDTFSFKVTSDESLPAKTIAKIRTEIKKELINRVLTMTASPMMTDKPAIKVPGVPPKRGAIVMAEGLNKVCGFNIYCQVGSWVLRIGDSIWGSSEAETTFKREWDRSAKEIWSQNTVSPRQATITFRR